MIQTSTKQSARRSRVESFRFFAIFLIVCGHIYLISNISHASFLARIGELALGTAGRYTMPFFFILAGYFTGGKIFREPHNSLAIAKKYTSRLISIFLFWCVIYAIARPQAFLQLVREEPIRLLFEGTKEHLWFLVSLILTVWLFVIWPARKSYKSFLLLGFVLYVIGLLGGAYKDTPIGFDMHFDTRNGVFFSTLFFAIGVMLSDKLPRMSGRTALGIALGGVVLYILEAFFLRMAYGLPPAYFDYLFSSIPLGVGVTLFCLTQPDTSLDNLMGPFGKYTLGIYITHLLFMDLLEPVTLMINSFALQLIWHVIFPLLVFGLSWLITVILSRTPLRGMVL